MWYKHKAPYSREWIFILIHENAWKSLNIDDQCCMLESVSTVIQKTIFWALTELSFSRWGIRFSENQSLKLFNKYKFRNLKASFACTFHESCWIWAFLELCILVDYFERFCCCADFDWNVPSMKHILSIFPLFFGCTFSNIPLKEEVCWIFFQALFLSQLCLFIFPPRKSYIFSLCLVVIHFPRLDEIKPQKRPYM